MKNDDIETLRILFNATIGELCNQERWNDAKEMEGIKDRLIQALESQSKDAISRHDAIHLADELKNDLPDDERIADMVMAHNEGILEYQTQLSLLPPVTPQPKRGRWIPGEKAPIECDRCGYGVMPWNNTEYCPKCGCRMVESQESEE